MGSSANRIFVNTAPVRRPGNLSSMVVEIASHVPRMRAAFQAEAEFWDWFAGEVDSVRRNAGSREEAERLVDMLKQAAYRAGDGPVA